MTSRQRAAARAAVYRTRAATADHVPVVIPIAVVVLLVFGWAAGVEVRPLLSAPTYAVVFAILLFLTHTLSFSVSNDSTTFGVRLLALSALAALAQVRVGGRSSLVPAALVASLAVLWTAMAVDHSPATLDGTLAFLPIPAFSGLAFICFTTAVAGRPSMFRVPRNPAITYPLSPVTHR